jgi:hypothetical protein
MGEAFDAAWEQVRDAEPPGLCEVVRDIMARAIIEAARAGERDVNRLREAALSALESAKVGS